MNKPKAKTTLNGNFLTKKLSKSCKHVFLIFLFFILVMPVSSQILSPSVVASGGNSNNDANCILDWTLGQIADETYQSTTVFLSQGFQQNFSTIPVQTEEIRNEGGFLLYPNPVSDHVILNLPAENKDVYTLELFNSRGDLLWVKTLAPGTISETIVFTSYPSGIYWLRITNNAGINVKTFKFVKL